MASKEMTTILATGCKARRARGAFSLIEVSIVVFIMAIIVAASMPSLVRTYNNAVLNDVVRAFGTTCQYARIQAITHQRQVVMHVDIKRQMFWVTQEPGQLVESGDAGSGDVMALKVYEIPKRVAMVSAELTQDSLTSSKPASRPKSDGSSVEQGVVFTFYPNGTCDGAVLVFRGAEPRDLLSVEVDPVTTRATAYPVKP